MNYIELLEKYMQGLTSKEEEKALLHWMQHDDEARHTIHTYYENRWNNMPKSEIPAELQHKMLMNIKKNIQNETKYSSKNNNRHIGIGKKIVWKDMMRYAAAVLITFSVSVFSAYYFFHFPVNEEEKVFVVYADKGQRSNLVLPDGTKVWLNSGSRLEYNNKYGSKERNVKLTGEAYFEVSKDKEHRFLVNTGIMDVEALGTSFNVQAYPEENKITTTLVEGKVRVNTPCKEVILLPNQQVSYLKTTNSMSVSKIRNAEYANGWIKGEFSFNKASLEDIARELSRMYNMEIKFYSDEIKKLHFTGVIKNNSLTNVLEIISLTSPVTFEVKQDSIILDKRKS